MDHLTGMVNSLCLEQAGTEKSHDGQPERCFHGRDYTPLSLLFLGGGGTRLAHHNIVILSD